MNRQICYSWKIFSFNRLLTLELLQPDHCVSELKLNWISQRAAVGQRQAICGVFHSVRADWLFSLANNLVHENKTTVMQVSKESDQHD